MMATAEHYVEPVQSLPEAVFDKNFEQAGKALG
jgi:hypothetical protein